MTTLSEVYESRLSDLVDRSRRILAATMLFAVGILVAGAVRSLQLSALQGEEAALTRALPESWEPIESLYTRTFGLMDEYATEHSTPWSYAYLLITIGLIWVDEQALNEKKGNQNITASIERTGILGRHLHDYNSDIRMIASAQRRGLAFESLSKPELAALVRIFEFKLSADEEKTRDDTAKFAAVIKEMGKVRPDILPWSDEAIATLQRFEQGERWTELRPELIKRDVRAMGNVETTSPQFRSLPARIAGLPGPTVGVVRARLRELTERRQRVRQDAGVSIPFLDVRVSAEYLLLGGAIADLALILGFLITVRPLVWTWQRLCELTPGLSSEYGGVICAGLSTASSSLRRLLQVSVMLSPIVCAWILFASDARKPWAIFIVAVLSLGSLLAMWAATSATAQLPPLRRANRPTDDARAEVKQTIKK